MREFEMIYRDEVSSKAVMIYRYLHDRQGKHENCFPSHRTIAMDTKCSVSTVKRAIDELVRKGYVVKEIADAGTGARRVMCMSVSEVSVDGHVDRCRDNLSAESGCPGYASI